MKVVLAVFATFCAVFALYWISQDDCVVRRAAFDVGSGTTRMKIADVNICKQAIENVIFEQSEKVDYKEDVIKNGGRFSNEIQTAGLAAFQRLKNAALEYGVVQGNFAGVATSAFRDAQNAGEYLETVEKEQGIRIRVISQRDEGVLGFYSTFGKVEVPLEKLIVWDIGGGSMQITFREGQQFVVNDGDLASVSFKNLVLKEVKRSNVDTPNPISEDEARAALEIAKSHAVQNVDSAFIEKIKIAGGVVYGIGGVLSISVKNQVGSSSYSREDVARTLALQLGKSDEEIGGSYASTDVTNLILVSGYMEGLAIDNIHSINANNTDGVLINPQYWGE